MSHMTVLVAPSVILYFATMTSHTVFALLAIKTYEKAKEQSLTEAEMTLSTRSVIHCAIKCRQCPHCTVFAYDDQLLLCLLRSAMSTTEGSANISTDNRLSVYKDTARHCPDSTLNISHGSVTIQRSLWSVEGNVTCDDDYLLLQNVTSAVTCLDDGSWSSIKAQCVKRVWRYPETDRLILYFIRFPITGTVIESWSLCVEGVPTNNSRTLVAILSGFNNVAVYTSWRFEGYLGVKDMVNGSWGQEERVWSPPSPLRVGKPFFLRMTVKNSTTIDIYMDNVFFNRHHLKLPLSSFSRIIIDGDVNVTKVESWCQE